MGLTSVENNETTMKNLTTFMRLEKALITNKMVVPLSVALIEAGSVDEQRERCLARK